VILVHVPDGIVEAQRWGALSNTLNADGWRHTTGVCPTSVDECSLMRQALMALGCTTVCQVPELGLGLNDFALATASLKLDPRMNVAGAVSHFRAWDLFPALYDHLQALVASLQPIFAYQTPRDEALVVASRHTWLLLMLGYRLAMEESRAAIADLPALQMPGVGLIDADGRWLGVYDLNPDS
jgi:hypothetical protein